MKRYYIPNSLFFKAIPTGIDDFLSIFSIEKKVHDVYNVKSQRVSRANSYAKRMYNRAEKQSIAGNEQRFTAVVTVIICKSKIFQVIALNKKYPKWFEDIQFSKFKKLWDKVMDIKRTLDHNIKYRRVWIPKGLEKYLRPLGCPDIEYIIQTWMIYYMLDIWITHNKGKAPWQHGGFSRKGSNTFFDQLIGEGYWRKPFIFEFDLVGYFNNISHAAILSSLKAIKLPGIIYNHIEGAIKVQPYAFVIPPKEEDKAIKQAEINKKTNEFMASMGLGRAPITRDDYDKLTGRQPKLPDPIKQYGFDPLMLNYTAPKMSRVYKGLMEKTLEPIRSPIPDTIRGIDSHSERARGRDTWAGLGREGYGTPQGISYSPTLTSIVSSQYIKLTKNNLGMYMDDGLIYADSQQELDAAIRVFEKGVKAMGVKIHPSKSGMVKVNGEWIKDLKIIGFRIDRFMDWIFSQTRSGTERPIPRPEFERLEKYQPGEFDKKLNEAIEKLSGLPEGSRGKLEQWVKDRLVEVQRLNPAEIISKEGYTGPLLAHVWNPKPQSREDILKGIAKAKTSLSHKKYTFLWDRLGPNYIKDVQLGTEDYTSLSTKVNIELLEWLERRGMNSSRKSTLRNSSKRK